MKKIKFIISLLLVTATIMAQDFDRTNWTVTTQTGTDYGFVPDGQTGLPEHLFDGKKATFLSLVKPGKTYGSLSELADFTPSFTVDLQTPQTFDYIKWNHRNGNDTELGINTNSYGYLRMYAVQLEGSTNGAEFTPIGAADAFLWIPNTVAYDVSASVPDENTYTISVPESTYRYVKVKIVMWSDIYAGQHPDYPGNGPTSGSTMQVSEFGLGKSGTSLGKVNTPAISIPTLLKAGQPLSIDGADMTVYSLLGAKISESAAKGGPVTINGQGTYIVKATKNGNVSTSKIVVK
jgi:hypothetical protein